MTKDQAFIVNSIKDFTANNIYNNVDRATLALNWARYNFAAMPSEQFGGPQKQPIFTATINSLLQQGILVRSNKRSTTYYNIA